MLIYLASGCYGLESAIGRSVVITVQIKLLEGEKQGLNLTIVSYPQCGMKEF
jgi:hypothetical protein